MTATELNTGAIKLHRDRYDDAPEGWEREEIEREEVEGA
jgi:hypothetical protein